jgi:hypothetical protein
MDPTTTLAMINDPDFPIGYRAHLLLELYAWLRKGGFMPCGEPGTDMHPTLTDEACDAMREQGIQDVAYDVRARLAYGD